MIKKGLNIYKLQIPNCNKHLSKSKSPLLSPSRLPLALINH